MLYSYPRVRARACPKSSVLVLPGVWSTSKYPLEDVAASFRSRLTFLGVRAASASIRAGSVILVLTDRRRALAALAICRLPSAACRVICKQHQVVPIHRGLSTSAHAPGRVPGQSVALAGCRRRVPETACKAMRRRGISPGQKRPPQRQKISAQRPFLLALLARAPLDYP